MAIVKLAEICEKIGSGATPRGGKEAYCDDGVSLVRSQNVLDFFFSKDGLAFINDEQAQKLSNVEVHSGDVLLNITGDSVARACIMDDDYLPARVNQHVAIIRGDAHKILNHYILYYLQWQKDYLLQLASAGATRNALTKTMIEQLELERPKLDEQKRIVAVLDSLQSKIQLNQKINDHLEQQAQVLFKKWFIDNPAVLSWKEGTFSDLIEKTISGDWGKDTPSGNNTEMVYCIRGADIPEVRAGNKGKMPTRYILPKNYAAKQLVDGDIVVEISGGSPTQSTGRAAAVSSALLARYDKGMVCTNFCKALKPHPGYSMYVYFYWQYGGQGGKPLSLKEINAQINELLKASIQSEGVINLFDSKEQGESFSLFDPSVLEEISKMKEKNIAVEILKKLIAEQVSIYKRTNVVKSQLFSEKITQLINAYYNGQITNEEVIKQLLETAAQIAEMHKQGDALGLSSEELAFYDALTKPEAIKDFYSNDELISLTRELTETLRKNRTIDWQRKETARAAMRKMVKRLLKKHKYPPEGMDDALETVMSQCEMWTDN